MFKNPGNIKRKFLFFMALHVFACIHTVSAQSVPKKNISVFLGGDFYFGETYQEREEKKGKKNMLKAYGYDYSLNKIAPLLQRADRVIVNLETPITDVSSSPFSGNQKYKIHRADINKTPAALKKFNISAVSLANNHTMDYGADGLKQTLNILRENSIFYFGADTSEKKAAVPLSMDFKTATKSIRIVIAGGLDFSRKYDSVYHFYADSNMTGVNAWTNNKAVKQINKIRSPDGAAFIIAYPHWFTNYKWKTNGEQELAHALIDAGADIVVGHGSHMFQEIEKYKDKWIIYSLGNFVFNAPGRYQKKNIHSYSLALMLEINEHENSFILDLKLYPILSDNHKTTYQPRFVNSKEIKTVYELLKTHSVNVNEEMDYETGKDESGYFVSLKVDLQNGKVTSNR